MLQTVLVIPFILKTEIPFFQVVLHFYLHSTMALIGIFLGPGLFPVKFLRSKHTWCAFSACKKLQENQNNPTVIETSTEQFMLKSIDTENFQFFS